MNVEFPDYLPAWKRGGEFEYHKYYGIHISYVLNILKDAGCNVKMVNPRNLPVRSSVHFDCKINNKLCRFDFSDFEKINPEAPKRYDVYFKFHFKDIHKSFGNVCPFSPVNFHNWNLYRETRNKVKYKGEGLILNNQTPFGAAIERRAMVAKKLKEAFGNLVDTKRYPKPEFYKLVDRGLVSVCVPGARNDMLDRGQGQHMMLGMCTLSPKLVTILSWNKKLIPNVHYIECNPDYSDLIEKIKWAQSNKTACLDIGNNAQDLMLDTSLPRRQVEWIEKCLL